MALSEQLQAVLARKRAKDNPRLRATRDALATWLVAEEILLRDQPDSLEKRRRVAEWESHREAYEKLAAALGDVQFVAEEVGGAN